MLKLYRVRTAQRIIKNLDVLIENICASCHLPPACLKAVLMMELPEIDLLDLAADAAVRLNWLRRSLGGSYRPERHTRNLLSKFDSSTGYGQIFSQVAIEAILFARSMGIPEYTGLPQELYPFRPEDLELVWKRLNRDRVFNLSCAALNLLHAAYQMTGSVDLASAGEEALKLTFSRYNGNVKKVTAYGEKAWSLYLAFQEEAYSSSNAPV